MNQGKNNLNSAGSKVILMLLILSLLVFTATRTLHFLQMTLPPDQQYMSYVGLVAFDIGVLGWLYYAMNGAQGTGQRVIAYGLIFVCAAGVVITCFSDMSLVSSENGMGNKLPPQLVQTTLYVVWGVIAINFIGGILVHLFDPKHQRHMVTEAARDRIFSAAHAAIDQRAQQIAPEIADAIAAYWQNQTIAELIGHIPTAKMTAALPDAKTVDALPAPQQEEVTTNAQTATLPDDQKKKQGRRKKGSELEESTQTNG